MLCCLIYILSFFHRVCPAVLAVDISRDLGVSVADIGFFSSATMLAYGLMQLPSGLLADAFDGRKVIIALSALAGLSTIGFACGSSYGFMSLSRFAVGLGLAVTVPALAILAAWVPAGLYGRVASLLLCCGGLGGILAAPPLALLSDALGWRMALMLFGGVTLCSAVCVAAFIPKVPPGQIARYKKSVSCAHILRGMLLVFRTMSFWPLALWSMCMSGAYFAMASLWWGPYMMEGAGLSKMQAGYVLTAISLCVLIGQPLMGALSDTVFRSRKRPVLACSIFGVLGALCAVMCAEVMSFPLMLAQMICTVVGTSVATPLVFAMIKESFPVSLAGTATGCLNMFYPVWAIVLQKLFGLALENAGPAHTLAQAYGKAYWVIVLNCLLAFAACFFMRDTFGSGAGFGLDNNDAVKEQNLAVPALAE